MGSYFIHDGQKELGPFTIEELKKNGIQTETPIWKENLNEWTTAGQLTELKEIVSKIPPPFQKPIFTNQKSINSPSVSTTEKVGFKIGRNLRLAVAVVIIIGVALITYNNVNGNRSSFSIPYLDPEHGAPSNYLTANGTYRSNFWGDKLIISGKILNSATHTNYKDVTIKVTFYSRTKSEIESKSYIIYDFVPYGASKEFELKVAKPKATETCGWEATDATFY
jgi:hypothetical protein